MLVPKSNFRTFLHRLISSPAAKVFIVSATCWLFAFQYCRMRYWREPHSAFFQPEYAHSLGYSEYREDQANDFIEATKNTNLELKKGSSHPEICAAFITVKRENKQYIDAAVGSMLEGLTDEERSKLYAFVLFADTNPTVHPTWNQPWLNNAVDAAVSYNVSDSVMEHLQALEVQRNFNEKAVFDYLYALDHCYSTRAPYIAMFEGDIILADGWMAKTRQALRAVEWEAGDGLAKYWDWVYLRLFYSETSIDWDDTDFMYRHRESIYGTAIICGYILLLFTRRFIPGWRRHLNNWTVAVICLATIPAFTSLIYMVGKNSLVPTDGVFKMNDGAYTQALIFPRRQVQELSMYLKQRVTGHMDTLINDFSNERKKQRLTLRRQLAQHVGLQNSQDTAFQSSPNNWAFGFEGYNPITLRREHEALIVQFEH